MIETKESLAEFEKRREVARAALRSAIKGELPLEPVKPKYSLHRIVPKPDTGPEVVAVLHKPKFDRNAYQRDLMRKRRAKAKNASSVPVP